MFASEANAGIRVFSGGKDLIDIADMAAEERDAILYCFDQNVKKIENISPKIAAGLRPQREAMVKFAQIAKGTFPETKTYSYPGQAGGLAVDFLNPYLLGYANIQTGTGCNGYFSVDGTAHATKILTWDMTVVAGTAKYILGYDTGAATQYYKGCGATNMHSYVVLFQDGIIELGTTPKFNELFFKTQLQDKYTPIGVHPLISQTVEKDRMIYQYPTPGMIPISHQTGVQIMGQPIYSGTSHLPLLGMVFYETDFNKSDMLTNHGV
jgi:hypothetical protein